MSRAQVHEENVHSERAAPVEVVGVFEHHYKDAVYIPKPHLIRLASCLPGHQMPHLPLPHLQNAPTSTQSFDWNDLSCPVLGYLKLKFPLRSTSCELQLATQPRQRLWNKYQGTRTGRTINSSDRKEIHSGSQGRETTRRHASVMRRERAFTAACCASTSRMCSSCILSIASLCTTAPLGTLASVTQLIECNDWTTWSL